MVVLDSIFQLCRKLLFVNWKIAFIVIAVKKPKFCVQKNRNNTGFIFDTFGRCSKHLSDI